MHTPNNQEEGKKKTIELNMSKKLGDQLSNILECLKFPFFISSSLAFSAFCLSMDTGLVGDKKGMCWHGKLICLLGIKILSSNSL